MHLIALYSRALHFEWDQPNCPERNGIIIRYELNITNEETGDSYITSSNTTGKLLQNLSPYINYALQVAASTKAGLGPFSAAIRTRTEEEGGYDFRIILKAPHIVISNSPVL